MLLKRSTYPPNKIGNLQARKYIADTVRVLLPSDMYLFGWMVDPSYAAKPMTLVAKTYTQPVPR